MDKALTRRMAYCQGVWLYPWMIFTPDVPAGSSNPGDAGNPVMKNGDHRSSAMALEAVSCRDHDLQPSAPVLARSRWIS